MAGMESFNPLKDAVPLAQVRRALVIKLRHHGDVLVSSPVFSVLKNHAPHVEIDALVYADTAEMLTLHPAIRQVVTVDRQWKKLGAWRHLQAEMDLYRQLKGRDYDLIIHLTEHWRGAWLSRLLGPKWAVSCNRPDAGAMWHKSFTHIYPMARALPRHMVENNLDALRRIGIQVHSGERNLLLVPGPAAESAVAGKLARYGLQPGQFIHIHPASRWLFKCWSVERMAALIQSLLDSGHQLVLTAAPSVDERRMIDAIQARLPNPVPSLSGELSLKELAALTKAARLFVGVDSAPMHIAAAVGTPVVALFGPSGDKQWGPWGAGHRVIASSQHTCRPCGLDGCGSGKVSDCLESLAVEDVLAAVREQLAS